MENIERKLSSRNPALIAQVFSQIIERTKTNENHTQEFAFLKSKCLVDNHLVSEAARSAIYVLVENNILQADQVLAEFVASISTASNIESLSKIILCLLNLGLKRNESEASVYKVQQHPLVKILQSDPQLNVQISIYNGLITGCRSLSSSFHEVYRPLYFYCLCSPSPKIELGFLRQKLWTYLINSGIYSSTDCIFNICCWLQLEKRNAAQTACLLNEALQSQLTNPEPLKHADQLILMQILTVCHLLSNGEECQLAVETLLEVLPKIDFCHHNMALLILSKAILVCPATYLEHLLILCQHLASNDVCKPYSFFALKAALLHWLSSPSLLCQKALIIARNILSLENHVCRERPLILASRLTIDRFHYLFFCNPELLLTLQLGVKIECTKDSEMVEFIESLQEVPMHFLGDVFTFLCGLLLGRLGSDEKIKVLNLVMKCSTYYPELLSTVLCVVLYLLSNSYDNKLHFELLKALPATVGLKENVPKVLATIQAFSKASPTLNHLSLRLLYDAWEIDNTCYSALESVFTLSVPNETATEVYEHNIAKGHVFKKLAEQRPELYGKDLVAHLSKILNECTTSEGAVATSLALEGIQCLCKSEVIDVVTTWATLSPKFKDDTRAPVAKSLCKLISEIPNLDYAQSFEKLNNEVIEQLWHYVMESKDKGVINAALDALSCFSLDAICLHIPGQFLEEAGAAKQTYAGENRIVPGKVWIKFLGSYKSPSAASSFVTKLVSKEIDCYLKYVYQLKSRREPDSYGGLPSHSVVRALGEYVKCNFLKMGKWESAADENLFTNCLRILSLKYSRPLPPLDWCFLQELIHVNSLSDHCLDLVSHQAILSGSARRLAENFIVAVTDEPQKAQGTLNVYKNLVYLANSIQPMVLRPFLVNTLQHWSETVDDSLATALECLKLVLNNKEIQDVNKTVVEEVLADLMFVSNLESKTFNLILGCLASFSPKGQEKVTRFSSDPVGQEEFTKITKVRCCLAATVTTGTPLVWLNDIFVVAFKSHVSPNQYFDNLTASFKKRMGHEDSSQWLNELFGDIQAKVADRCPQEEIGLLCDVLTLAAACFSGLSVITPKYDHSSVKYFFPAVLKYLIEEPHWSYGIVQILEWLHYMNSSESIPEEYKNIFGWALASLRHEDEFAKSPRWLRYLDSQIYVNNVL